MIARIVLIGIGVVVLIAAAVTGTLYVQGKRQPDISGEYVALGGSYAAGIGLGERAPGSPFVCERSTNGYPSIVARKLGVSLVDMACSSSTTVHTLHGGQMFLGPQVDAIGPSTRLVTMTTGGNDVSYIGDLFVASGRGGILSRIFVGSPQPIESRRFDLVKENFVQIVREARKRAPNVRMLFVGYPQIVPAAGTCEELGISPEMAALSREVLARVNAAKRQAAEQTGSIYVDMAAISADHTVCSPKPWVNGYQPAMGAPFHPNAAGAQAIADAVTKAVAR